MSANLDYLLRDFCAFLPQDDTDDAVATGLVEVDGTPVIVGPASDDRRILLTTLLDAPDDAVPREMLDEQILIHDFNAIGDAGEIRFSRPPGSDYLVAASLSLPNDGLDSGRDLLEAIRLFITLAEERLLDLGAFALAYCVDTLDLAGARDEEQEPERAAPELIAWLA